MLGWSEWKSIWVENDVSQSLRHRHCPTDSISVNPVWITKINKCQDISAHPPYAGTIRWIFELFHIIRTSWWHQSPVLLMIFRLHRWLLTDKWSKWRPYSFSAPWANILSFFVAINTFSFWSPAPSDPWSPELPFLLENLNRQLDKDGEDEDLDWWYCHVYGS